jgi:methionyl-tRNA synthetase
VDDLFCFGFDSPSLIHHEDRKNKRKEPAMSTPTNPEPQPTLYITTSIPYVNAQPHIGHALEFVQSDVLARYYRQAGYRVRLQSGTDENSLKNVQAAEQAGVSTANLVAQNSARFQALSDTLGLSFDDFIRTSAEPRHTDGVYRLWQACAAHGDIYKRPYRGLYCVGCEQFYELDELDGGRCPSHDTALEVVEEENYFFRLSRYSGELTRLIESDLYRIVPEARKNEVLAFIQRGLHDFSISRSQARARGWGIPVPGDARQVIYVWFDALTNYISALDYAHDGAAYGQYWQQSNQRIHVIGKDITRFHAIYWPAMLLSAGVPLPTTLFVHGFVTVNGRKMSKSLGNVVDPVTLVQAAGTDALRYFLLRKIPAAQDGDFTHDEFTRTYNADLADQLGNLVSRVLKLIVQAYGGIVPTPGLLTTVDAELVATAQVAQRQVAVEVEHFAFHKALAALWALIEATNKYIVTVEPWVLARVAKTQPTGEAAQRLATTLALLAETLRIIAELLQPFLPATAAAIVRQLGLTTAGARVTGAQVQPTGVLFPKQDR